MDNYPQKTGAKNIFSFFKQALNGSEQDYTTGSIRKAVFMLAIPVILELMMEYACAFVTILCVGCINILGVEKWGFTREDLDQYSADSHTKAFHAINEGHFENEIIPVNVDKEDGTVNAV